MSYKITSNTPVNEFAQASKDTKQYNISYRGEDFERSPETDSFDSGNKKSKKAVGIAAVLLGVVTLGLGFLAYKGHKALPEGERGLFKDIKKGWEEFRGKDVKGADKGGKKKSSENAAENAAEAKFDINKASNEELVKIIEKTDRKDIQYYFALEKLSDKEPLKYGEELIKYYDDIMAGKIKWENPKPLSCEYFLMDSSHEWAQMAIRKERVFCDMASAYKKANNLEKSLEMYSEAYKFMNNPSIARNIAKIHALRGTPEKGIEIAVKDLEKVKDEIFHDEQVFLFDGITECLNAMDKKDLAKSISLLKKGSYHFDQLTKEDIKFLTDRNIDYNTICGGGGREQTGAMAKWVLKELENLKLN